MLPPVPSPSATAKMLQSVGGRWGWPHLPDASRGHRRRQGIPFWKDYPKRANVFPRGIGISGISWRTVG